MKRLALCCLLLTIGLLCRLSLVAAGKAETTDTVHTSQDGNAADSARMKKIPAGEFSTETTKSGETSSSVGEGVKESGNDNPVSPSDEAEKEGSAEDSKSGTTNSGTTSPAAGTDEKKAGSDEPVDVTFASIHSKGLTVADGNKWYYETFDRQGRSSFAVLYEDGTAIEKTVWTYKNSSRYPTQKKILRAGESKIFRFDEDGRELSIERYEGKTLVFKTENVYNHVGKLIEQTITALKNTDRSVWEFVGDKAVTQTKYRNGKKIAFIELHSTPHIVHLYVDDKEVYVGEEQ